MLGSNAGHGNWSYVSFAQNLYNLGPSEVAPLRKAYSWTINHQLYVLCFKLIVYHYVLINCLIG